MFDRLHELYEKGLGYGVGIEPLIRQEVTDILSPEQLNDFLQSTRKYENHLSYSHVTSQFITRLIQTSYDSDNNGFFFDTSSLKDLVNFGLCLNGSEDRVLNLYVDGDLGNGCFSHVYHSNISIDGSVGDEAGFKAENSTIRVSGDGGIRHGWGAVNSYLEINCVSNALANYAERSTFVVNSVGNIPGKLASGCTFKTANKETYEKLKKLIPSENSVYFIHQDGSEEKK